MPNLFTAIGYADTRPLPNSFSKLDPKNRRVEILILKNRNKDEYELTVQNVASISTAEQEQIQNERIRIIHQVEKEALTPEARLLLNENRKKLAAKQKSDKMSDKNKQLYINLENESPKATDDNLPHVDKRVIELKSNMPEDEDFGL